MKTLILLLFIFLSFSSLFASNSDEIILELKPKDQYDENMRYNKVEEYKKTKKTKKSDVDIDIGVDVNKEEKAIDRLKLDMGKSF